MANYFDGFKYLDGGAFGRVHSGKVYDEIYAIKKIRIENLAEDLKENNREIILLKKLKSEFVVKIYNHYKDEEFLYIQMEFCNSNLKEIIRAKSSILNHYKFVDFLISCEIFREILDCLEFLHTRKPPIIH